MSCDPDEELSLGFLEPNYKQSKTKKFCEIWQKVGK